MKTNTNTTNQPARHLSIANYLLPMVMAGALSSCGTQSIAIRQSEPVPGLSAPTIRVWQNLPSELLQGLEVNAPTRDWDNSGVRDGATEMISLVRFSLPL